MRRILAIAAAIIPGASFAQISTVGPFTGTFSDGYETQTSGSFASSLTLWGGHGSVNQIGSGQGLLVTPGWSFFEGISPHSGSLFMGGAGVNYTFVFNAPVTEFGGYFGTNSNAPDAVATFYNAQGAQIGSPMAVSAPLGAWAWDGWQDAAGFSSVSIVANNTFGGFIDSDDVQIVPLTTPEPASFLVLGGLIPLFLRRRRSSK